MFMACLDLEGVLVPEIWINVAEATGVDDLRLTTRDLADYDELMQHRLRVLDSHGIRLSEIQQVIAGLGPLPGAAEFLDWLRERFQVLILSDTFYQFGMPLMAQLGYPTLLCHDLDVTADRIVGYRLRQQDQKTKAVAALQSLNLKVIATGDSYNDTGMLTQAEAGILFRPPASLVTEFQQFPVARDYAALRDEFQRAADRVG
ncbi:MAG: bifunctional phosphoserine phosphatase/homoserine phosphotransferase ThrH [Propioniciclava sp.]